MSEWHMTELGELTRNFDSRRKPIKGSERRAGEFPYYGASGVVDHVDGYLFDGEYLLVSEDGENLRTRVTPIGFIATGKFWVNNHAHVITGNAHANTRFLSYALAHTDISGYLTGSTQPKLSRRALDSILVRVPSRDTQDAIAEVLGALDDKIAANHKMADLADAYLRAAYRRAADATLPLGDVLVQIRDGISPEELQPGTAYVGLEHVPRRSLWLSDWAFSETVTSGKSRFEVNDVLFGKLRPYFHKVVSVPVSGVCSTDILVLRAKDKVLPGIAMLAASSDHVVAEATTSSSGTRMPRADWKVLCDVNVPWPNDAESARGLNDLAETTRSFVYSLFSENRALEKTRDSLLPQLMSRKLQIRDAESLVADIV